MALLAEPICAPTGCVPVQITRWWPVILPAVFAVVGILSDAWRRPCESKMIWGHKLQCVFCEPSEGCTSSQTRVRVEDRAQGKGAWSGGGQGRRSRCKEGTGATGAEAWDLQGICGLGAGTGDEAGAKSGVQGWSGGRGRGQGALPESDSVLLHSHCCLCPLPCAPRSHSPLCTVPQGAALVKPP